MRWNQILRLQPLFSSSLILIGHLTAINFRRKQMICRHLVRLPSAYYRTWIRIFNADNLHYGNIYMNSIVFISHNFFFKSCRMSWFASEENILHHWWFIIQTVANDQIVANNLFICDDFVKTLFLNIKMLVKMTHKIYAKKNCVNEKEICVWIQKHHK